MKPASEQMWKELVQSGSTREEKDLQKQIPKIKKMAIGTLYIYIYTHTYTHTCTHIYFIYILTVNWGKCSNQKTGWIDTKARLIYMLSTRNLLQT